ncbi:hypothetical protein MTR_2g437190 [Medicago truncatula]|uniref:Uncharacterized protein n=1 Tax=Medicago truncatula TaxID=3880 RepID=A0A072V653_MEDTR|nr:hypothetical protein MTR_2g437190 [Medicago truncatula]
MCNNPRLQQLHLSVTAGDTHQNPLSVTATIPPPIPINFKITSIPNRFPQLHQTSPKNSLNCSLILRHKSNLYQINDFSNLTTRIKLNLPFEGFNNFISLLGSCNGLLYIFSNGEIALWNPNIRKHRIIPDLPILIPDPSASSLFVFMVSDLMLEGFMAGKLLETIKYI